MPLHYSFGCCLRSGAADCGTSLLLMEIIPLGGAAYYGAVQPDVPYLGWQFDAVLCLWLASAVLLGYILAWGIYAVSKLR